MNETDMVNYHNEIVEAFMLDDVSQLNYTNEPELQEKEDD